MRALGWESPDIVFVTGDAYVDHPSFAMAVLGRVLEGHGYKVAILPQPDWKSADAWRDLGRPRLFYAVSAGNMDSMINHYTANRKRRNDDAYSPGGAIGLRPDRPTPVYAQRCREAFAGVPVVIGGIEASLRRIAHYDYWSDTVRPSILATSKADLLAFGKGEHTIVSIAQRLDAGEPIDALRDMRGVCYLLGKNEASRDDAFEHDANNRAPVELPSYEGIKDDKLAFATMTRKFHEETNPFNARRITQRHGDRMLVQNPPCLPISEDEMDGIYDLPYTRAPHPRYSERIPAHTMIKDSVQIMRGCFGGCTFCSITMHEGRIIQSRSQRSIVDEVKQIAAEDGFKGTISDLGGPTANMYRMRCTRPEVEAVCRRPSCIHPTVCKLLGTDHKPTIGLMRATRNVKGVKKVHIASGIRMDLANLDDEYIDELVGHHVGGHLKVAPEHVSDVVLNRMKKPSHGSFETFAEKFADASERAGKEQYLVPYFIASHPGSGLDEMIELAVFLKQRGYRPRQVQDFIPAPMDVATCIFFTGLDPVTMKPVTIVRRMRDRKTQRALMQFFKPENWFEVHAALVAAGRRELIGSGPLALIPATPPREALESRKKGGSKLGRSTYVHSEDAGTAPSVGYRPGRKGTRRRDRLQ
ncbi:MAG: YgiQ family radical SAM protein [Planctomycetota bacterium]